MSKLILYIFKFSIFCLGHANETRSPYVCKWENKSKIPCLEIKSSTSNSSNLSTIAINKIIISKKKLKRVVL